MISFFPLNSLLTILFVYFWTWFFSFLFYIWLFSTFVVSLYKAPGFGCSFIFHPSSSRHKIASPKLLVRPAWNDFLCSLQYNLIFFFFFWDFDFTLNYVNRYKKTHQQKDEFVNYNISLVFARSSHTKDSKMVLDPAFLNTQHYKVGIKGKVEQSSEWSRILPYTLVQ